MFLLDEHFFSKIIYNFSSVVVQWMSSHHLSHPHTYFQEAPDTPFTLPGDDCIYYQCEAREIVAINTLEEYQQENCPYREDTCSIFPVSREPIPPKFLTFIKRLGRRFFKCTFDTNGVWIQSSKFHDIALEQGVSSRYCGC